MKKLFVLLSFLVSLQAVGQTDFVRAHDAQWRFSIERPKSWVIQPNPNSETRLMFGIAHNNHVGNCNVVVLAVPMTTSLTQAQVDVSQNRRALNGAYFQNSMQNISPNVRVSSVKQTQRGELSGHLVQYTYSYRSPSINEVIFARSEMFSHSRPGAVFTFTCVVGAKTSELAEVAFATEQKLFEKMMSSLRMDANSTAQRSAVLDTKQHNILTLPEVAGVAEAPRVRMSFQEARKKLPQFDGLDDASFLDLAHERYYPKMDKAELAAQLGYTQPEPLPKRKLGAIDQWRFQSCLSESTKAPTERGVSMGLKLCHERFGQ